MKFSLPAAFLLFLTILLFIESNAQTNQYYVVIGAFAKESNAKKFSGFSRSRFFQSTYEINPLRKLFYVYVIKTSDREEAYNQVRILQKEEAFHDSWVFNGSLGIAKPPVVVLEPKPIPEEQAPVPVETPPVTEIKVEPIIIQTIPPTEQTKRVVKGKLFKFDIRSPEGEPFAGSVHHVDLLNGREIASYLSTDYSDVPRPADKIAPMTIVCGIFGYKEITQMVDYENPALIDGAKLDEENAWVIPFKLERLKKGDVSVMYNVSFYKNAVVMLPRSQEELDELINMMTSNPGYIIKIHGHANGNGKQKIIALGKTRNYFDMKGSNQQNGSSKELSKQRAEAVRDYLVEHGIKKSRMELLAWGGTNMLVGENTSGAKLNDRIEIEILEDTVK